MLSDTDKKELEEHFSKHYLLIPKNRLYHVVGGILAFLVVGLGISYQAVLKVLESQMANEARQNIIAIEKEVRSSQQRIEGIEHDARNVIAEVRSTAVQESDAAKQRIAEVEQAGKKAAENLSATTIESLKAKEIAIVDDDGKTKLVLGTAVTGSGFFALYDSKGKERVQLGANENGDAGAWISDGDGMSRMSLLTNSAGLPSLNLYDSKDKKRLQLYENNGGHAGLGLIDRDDKWRMVLTTSPDDGTPSLEFKDKNKSVIRKFSDKQ